MRFSKTLLCTFIVCIAILVGCSPTPKVQVDKLSSITVFYTDAENQTQFIDFDSDSSELASLKTWLQENKKGWKNYLATPSVGDMTITSQGVSLTIGNDWIVMREGGGTDKVRQLHKTITASDLAVFQALK